MYLCAESHRSSTRDHNLADLRHTRMDEPALPITNNRLSIRVKPKAKQTKITKVESGVAFIDVAAPPEDNKANIELLKFLRRHTGRPCRLVQGAASKSKVVAFD